MARNKMTGYLPIDQLELHLDEEGADDDEEEKLIRKAHQNYPLILPERHLLGT